MFRPKLLDTLSRYTIGQFRKDLVAGLIVGIVALPLAIAFAIASGVSPEKGLYTAIIAGFIISAMGGSKVQIGGPTGAFIVIVYGIVQAHGVNGLIIATLMAGVMLIIMGIARLGSVIKYIPHPLVIGFTTGISLIIFSSQIKDFLGLEMNELPADFIGKWKAYAHHFNTINPYAFANAGATVLIIMLFPRITHKIPGTLAAILLTTISTQSFGLPVETIGSRFGTIATAFPTLAIPQIDLATIKALMQPAFTIALLGGIESLLSALVADGMIGGNHKSNMELCAQGTANVFSALFGGIPATGAIARTATNIKNGGRTPVAGIIHSITLLAIVLFFGQWAALIPMSTLAGILVVVAYHMSEWQSFRSVLRGARSDAAVLLVTFILTVFIDLTIAIEVGIVLATFLFMRDMIHYSNVNILTNQAAIFRNGNDKAAIANFIIPRDVEVFEITGPLFFGAAHKFKDAIKLVEKAPKVLIIRMRQVPIIDATGIKTIEEIHKESKQRGTKLILSEVNSSQVLKELKNSRLQFAIGKANITSNLAAALKRSKAIILQP
ncbi:SulP family inorganic anion transporter [Flavihumibacter solisilvae]|uniref:Sulfate permease n=1 Tax=Flavihumibacter solisilvae TaxID=1349421 RepID=A0A0C1IKB4_9BACT|nr:SulP family inorganic anion transporter [Flavihumibacter solisilvae]KIC94620.1 sulfate permease [Flavihumibacter solisilvae]